MLFLRKIFSLKKRLFPENNFSERDGKLLKYSFFYKQLTFFKSIFVENFTGKISKSLSINHIYNIFTYKICWKELQNTGHL